MKTKEKLAQVLRSEGLFDLEKKAREGYYDDFESPLATPIVQLVHDLRERDREDLAVRAINGEWDGTLEEAEEWYKKEEHRLLP